MTITFERLETQPEFRVADLAQMTTEQAALALVRRAAELRASDLFVLSDARYVTVSVKRLGSVDRLAVLSTEFGRQLMSYVKAYAELDISEKRRPADSRWIVQLADRRLDLRINFTPTLHGEDLAIRISDHALGMYELAELGLSQTDFTGLRSLLQSSHGLLVVTGPTGAGKTTTLYACLRYLNDGSRKINTLEDPVEYSLDGIRQSQINLKLGLDFAELLRNVLRQAPDVIMIGEIRDPETMSTAIRAANSGLLVLATLHAPTAAGSIQSMLALEANPFFLSNCLLGVVSQRLVRTLCRECRTPADPSASAAALNEVAELRGTNEPTAAFEPVGCETCYHRGYAGRSGLFEWMRITPEIRRLIAAAKSTREIEAAAIRAGMVEFRRSGLLKVAEGITSADEILREIPAETSWENKGYELGK
jgi:type II secretory ATPase GspE/PulE/Tfp pilus assembly ATPase PilB-like protein